MTLKECTHCHLWKSLDEFAIRNGAKCGHASWCKDCKNDYQKTPKGKLTSKKSRDKYKQTPKGIVSRKRADAKRKGNTVAVTCIECGKLVLTNSAKNRYCKSCLSIKDKEYKRKDKCKRRGYDDIKLYPNPFDDSVFVRWHHVSDEFVVAIPKDIHILYTGFKEHRELCMNVVNQIYIEGD